METTDTETRHRNQCKAAGIFLLEVALGRCPKHSHPGLFRVLNPGWPEVLIEAGWGSWPGEYIARAGDLCCANKSEARLLARPILHAGTPTYGSPGDRMSALLFLLECEYEILSSAGQQEKTICVSAVRRRGPEIKDQRVRAGHGISTHNLSPGGNMVHCLGQYILSVPAKTTRPRSCCLKGLTT
jgi:hypothetical protein